MMRFFSRSRVKFQLKLRISNVSLVRVTSPEQNVLQNFIFQAVSLLLPSDLFRLTKQNLYHMSGNVTNVPTSDMCAQRITKTCLYNFDPLKPQFYIVKLVFTGVYIIFLTFAQKHRLSVLVRTASPMRF